jgi:hypothetical protein
MGAPKDLPPQRWISPTNSLSAALRSSFIQGKVVDRYHAEWPADAHAAVHQPSTPYAQTENSTTALQAESTQIISA